MTYVVDDQGMKLGNEASKLFFEIIERVTSSNSIVAFDCEGINLSRLGTVEIVSLYVEENGGITFLVDLHNTGLNAALRHERVVALKKLFESNSVTKVIHDCRMDSDALYHLEGISLNNVHDTSCYHFILTGTENKSLNDVLEYNDIIPNASRDKSIYNNNYQFWATRPMSPKMIEWASGDVNKLLTLACKQKQACKLLQMDRANEESKKFAEVVRSMYVVNGVTLKIQIGRFIGPRGSNIRRVQKNTGTVIYRDGTSFEDKWMIFYPNIHALNLAKREMGH